MDVQGTLNPTPRRSEAPPAPAVEPSLMARLASICRDRGMDGLALALTSLAELVTDDLAAMESELRALPRRGDRVGKSATHLVELEGKRLRPLCVALAARVGDGFSPKALRLGVAVELVHSATLLHDDVIDVGTLRRGVPTARVLYGNAASVYAGDWLLVEALRLVSEAEPALLASLLNTLDEMIQAEALQLELRGKLVKDRSVYFRVVEGKTAALFRWGMRAGAFAGGLSPDATRALEIYGHQLGIAFQVVDDALDLIGNATETGKALFTDLREGKLTYPLIEGMERDPSLVPLLGRILEEEQVSPEVGSLVLRSLEEQGAIAASLALAESAADRAVEALAELPDTPARSALEVVARTAVRRRR